MSVRKAVSSQTISDDKIALRVKILKIHCEYKTTYTYIHVHSHSHNLKQLSRMLTKINKYCGAASQQVSEACNIWDQAKLNCCPRFRSLLGVLSLNSSPEEPTSPAIICWSSCLDCGTQGSGYFHSILTCQNSRRRGALTKKYKYFG